MVTYFCPNCGLESRRDEDRCPACGFDIRRWAAKGYADKLIAALKHPIPEIVLHAAWVLGRRREAGAADALCALAETTPDVYVAAAAVCALGDIGTPEALAFLNAAATHHPASMVRKAASTALHNQPVPSPSLLPKPR